MQVVEQQISGGIMLVTTDNPQIPDKDPQHGKRRRIRRGARAAEGRLPYGGGGRRQKKA